MFKNYSKYICKESCEQPCNHHWSQQLRPWKYPWNTCLPYHRFHPSPWPCQCSDSCGNHFFDAILTSQKYSEIYLSLFQQIIFFTRHLSMYYFAYFQTLSKLPPPCKAVFSSFLQSASSLTSFRLIVVTVVSFSLFFFSLRCGICFRPGWYLALYSQEWYWTSDPPAPTSQVLEL